MHNCIGPTENKGGEEKVYRKRGRLHIFLYYPKGMLDMLYYEVDVIVCAMLLGTFELVNLSMPFIFPQHIIVLCI